MVKLSLALSLVMAAVANLPGTTQAKPMETCSQQSSCIKFEKNLITRGDTCSDGGCEWEVCATLNQNDSRCIKDGAISHTCVKPDDTCSTNSGFSKAMEVTSGLDDGYKQCQIVKGGATVEFLFKDGQGCAAGGTATSGDFSCKPRATDTPSCTGNGLGKECIWTTTVPECQGDDSGSDGDADSTADDSGSDGDGDSTTDVKDSAPCSGFSADKPYNAPQYVVNWYENAPTCTYGPGQSEGFWVCRSIVDEDTGVAQTFSACVANDKFIESDKEGCCGECPKPCECPCTRKSGGTGVLIQKSDDPDCLKCYAPYGAFRKVGLDTGYECVTECVE